MSTEIGYKFNYGDKVRKVGGNYQAEGVIVGLILTTSGDDRYVFEFDEPKGMLHIFNGQQLELIGEEDAAV